MSVSEPKAVLLRYLTAAHEAVLWKVQGLSDFDLRRPLTPTGTNLLGLVKHMAIVELGYFGDVFDRPHGLDLPSSDAPNSDMFATADETTDELFILLGQALTHATTTIDSLDLDTEGHVPWWGDNNPVTLRLIVVHVTTEFHRHLGQVDILREGLDGMAGLRESAPNMGPADDASWSDYRQQVQDIADGFLR